MWKLHGCEDGRRKFKDLIEDGRRIRLYSKARDGYLYAGEDLSVQQVHEKVDDESRERTVWEVQHAFFEGQDCIALKSCTYKTYLSATSQSFGSNRSINQVKQADCLLATRDQLWVPHLLSGSPILSIRLKGSACCLKGELMAKSETEGVLGFGRAWQDCITTRTAPQERHLPYMHWDVLPLGEGDKFKEVRPVSAPYPGGKKDMHYWDNLSARACRLGQLVIQSGDSSDWEFLATPPQMLDKSGDLKLGKIGRTVTSLEDLSYWREYSYEITAGASAPDLSLDAKAASQEAQGFVLKSLDWQTLDWSPSTPLEHYSEDLCKLLKEHCPYWQGDGPHAMTNARMGIVAGIITATGGCMFTGGRATLQAAGKLKLNGHGVPIDAHAGWSVQHASAAHRNLRDNKTQVVAYAVREIDWSMPAHPKISSKFVCIPPQQADKKSMIPSVWGVPERHSCKCC